MREKIFAILLLLIAASVQAQNADEIRAMFPGEQAVILNHQVHYTIKLVNAEPQVESDDNIDLLFLSENAGSYMSRYSFYQSSFRNVKKYEAYTVLPSGKKAAVSDFKTTHNTSNSVFYDDVKETSFDFPSITPGAVGHLQYVTAHSNARLLSPHYFSRSVPVINGELKISFPKDMTVKYLFRGNNQDKIQFSSETRKGETTYTFRVSKLAKDYNYPDAPDDSYYALHVIFYIESYQADGKTISYLANTDDLYKLQWSFIKDINKTISPELKTITDSLVKGLKNNEQKARSIYRWVQKNIKYVAFEEGMEGFVPREANLVCNRRFGDCKDMASILTVMLNHAGVPAWFTWIGTRSLPYEYNEVPLPIVDNHMIAAIKLDTSYIFLDGTDSHIPFGIPAEHIQGKQAMIGINEKDYKIIRVPVAEKNRNVVSDTTFIELTDKGITGRVNINLSGYPATRMYSVMSYTNEKEREKYFRGYFNRGSNKFKLNKYDIVKTEEPGQFKLSAQFDLQDYGKKIADEWYLNLNLFKHYEHQEIDFPRRNLPVEYDYKHISTYVTVLSIPEGYKVSYLPESKTYKNDIWGFTMKYEEKNNKVILSQQFENNFLLLQPDKFQEWNKVLEQLFPLYRETISLSKK